MDKKSILKEIKNLLSFNSDLKFLDAKLADGITIVRVEADAFAVGLPLLVVTENGLTQAPTGSHILEDGTEVVVDELGMITAITPPSEAPVEAPVEALATEEMSDENFYTWDACMVDMMDEYGDEAIAQAVCGKIKADGYIMSKEEAFAEGQLLMSPDTAGETAEAPVEAPVEDMKKKYQELEARISEVEKMVAEVLPMMKETAEFGANVLDKIDNFVADTPAEQQFASIKTEYKNMLNGVATKKVSALESITNLRKK